MGYSELTAIPGIGKTFARDFARVQIETIEDLAGHDPDELFQALVEENLKESHKTSKNYLYVLRMAVYYANGGRDQEKLKWSYWKDFN